jgi:hypothetical protein
MAKRLWPELALIETHPGELWDIEGVDCLAVDPLSRNWKRVQVKYDSGIYDARTNDIRNLWHEVYEKTDRCPWQPWRKTGGMAYEYIFVTESPTHEIGIRIPTDTLARAEYGKELTVIRPNGRDETSMGFIIPIKELQERNLPFEVRRLEKTKVEDRASSLEKPMRSERAS